MKGDYLYHFNLPQLDLLVWILIMKLVLTYYQKLEVMLNDIGCFCELPKWRIKAMRTQITMPMNERYHPDIRNFICTCPQFIMSQFLLCKHLVQQLSLVDPHFFPKVTQNCTLPTWSHPLLKLLAMVTDVIEPVCPKEVDGNEDNPVYDQLNLAAYTIDNNDGLINTEGGGERTEKNMVKEKMEGYICIIQKIYNSLKYQLKFQDPQFLTTLEKDGTGFITLAQNCLSCERW